MEIDERAYSRTSRRKDEVEVVVGRRGKLREMGREGLFEVRKFI
jgi:hypothetical protein